MPNKASEQLRNSIDKIMRIWEARARAEVASAPNHAPALRNSIPEYLLELADILSVATDKNGHASIGKKHGRTRAKTPHYTIDQLIFEYHILRQVIFEVIEENVELSIPQRDIIIDSIEQSVSDAATEFSDYLKGIQETLSRTLVHDLRSPLTIAKLSLGLIRSSHENVTHNKLIQTRISNSLDRIDLMTYQLLDASIIKAGQGVKLHIENLDLSALIYKFAGDFNFIASERFIINTPETLIGFWDGTAITRALENLATNALKYSAPQTPIWIAAERKEKQVRIVVHNSGKTISPKDQTEIFQEFHRAKDNEDEPGWGVGLTVVKLIAEAHGGHVKVESFENTGTSFTVQLPIDCRKLEVNGIKTETSLLISQSTSRSDS